MTVQPLTPEAAGEVPMKPRFGDIIENGWASADNPTRVGYFVREGRRTGRMNAGRYFEVTDGAGKFWELPLGRDHKITVRAPDDGEGRVPSSTTDLNRAPRDSPNPPQTAAGRVKL